MTTRILRDSLLMDKTADAMETTEKDRPPSDIKLYKDPPGRGALEGTLDAPVGEKAHPDPTHNSSDVWYQFLEGNPQLIGKAFTEFNSAAKKEKAFVAEHFDTKNYESRRALLRKYSSADSIPDGQTISEKLAGLLKKRSL